MPVKTTLFYHFIRGKLYDLSCDSWNIDLNEDIRQKMAHMATSAAWGLGETIDPSNEKHVFINITVQFVCIISVCVCLFVCSCTCIYNIFVYNHLVYRRVGVYGKVFITSSS